MRAVVADRRLEAIAGPPLVSTTTPTYGPRGASAFVVFAGVLGGSGVQVAIQCRTSLGTPEVNLNRQVTATLNSGTVLATVHEVRPGVLAASAPVTHGDLGLGLGGYSQPWQGAFRAVTYDRVLTSSEAFRVAAWLSLSDARRPARPDFGLAA